MVILCGVDGSAPAHEAARAAAALAKRTGDTVELLHVQDVIVWSALGPEGAGVLTSQEILDAERQRAQADLEPLCKTLSREFQTAVVFRIESGLPDLELARRARASDASLVVVGAVGRRKGSMWRLGSVADRLSQTAPVPVLIVREAQSLARWALEERPLRIVLGLGEATTTRRALEAVSGLRRAGPCEVVEVHVYDPRREAHRLGIAAESPESQQAIESSLARELPERSGEPEPGETRFVALPVRDSVAETLAEFAEEERADLVVAGSRGRGALERRFLGSVSYGLTGLAGSNVLIAHGPRASPEARAPRVPARVRTILVATDFSERGNRALDFALGLSPEGGQLVLLHVLPAPLPARVPQLVPDPLRPTPEHRRMTRALAEAELRQLLPATARELELEVEAIECEDAARGILQAAERHGADLVILGRHGHGMLAAARMGSVARAVARRSPRPVLLVPEARDGE